MNDAERHYIEAKRSALACRENANDSNRKAVGYENTADLIASTGQVRAHVLACNPWITDREIDGMEAYYA